MHQMQSEEIAVLKMGGLYITIILGLFNSMVLFDAYGPPMTLEVVPLIEHVFYKKGHWGTLYVVRPSTTPHF